MKRIRSIALLALFIGAASLVVIGCKTHEEMRSASGASHPSTKCVVCGENLGDKPSVFTHNGQTIKICCKDCVAKFNLDPDKYMAKMNPNK